MNLSILAAAGGQNYSMYILLILLFAGSYFFMFRPQKKQQAKRAEMMKEMKKGDAVVTIGGMKGKIDEIDQAAKEVVIDVDGVFLTFDLAAIRSTTPAASTTATTSTSTEKITEDKKDEK